MNMATRTSAGQRSRPATVLPRDERHHRPAATDARPGPTGTPYPLFPLLAVMPVDASTTLAMVGQLLRASRPDSLPPPAPAPSGLVVDAEGREAWIDGTRLELTFREFELLDFFVSNPGKVFPRGQLLGVVWGRHQRHGTRTVDVHVHRLRRKLGAKYGQCLVTMRQAGYKFIPPAAQPGR